MRTQRNTVFGLTPQEMKIFEVVERDKIGPHEACKKLGIPGVRTPISEKFRMYRLVQAEKQKTHDPISPKRAKGRICMDLGRLKELRH